MIYIYINIILNNNIYIIQILLNDSNMSDKWNILLVATCTLRENSCRQSESLIIIGGSTIRYILFNIEFGSHKLNPSFVKQDH